MIDVIVVIIIVERSQDICDFRFYCCLCSLVCSELEL